MQEGKEKEQVAVEVFTISFVSISRVVEILGLTCKDVAVDGSFISIRAKTFASTCQKHVKRISDGCGLFPRGLLARRRRMAVLEGRKFLFSLKRANGEETQLTSSDVSQSLRRVLKRVQMKRTITSHSGRKGGAVEALLVGVPIVAIQAWGVWSSVDTLQAYLGKAVRENCGVLEVLEDKLNRDRRDEGLSCNNGCFWPRLS